MPLLGPKEKAELAGMVLKELLAHWDAKGSAGLIGSGVNIALSAKGASIVPARLESALANVEIRTLFTAVCHLSADGPDSLPRDSLDALAREAAAALAAQVNRLSPG